MIPDNLQNNQMPFRIQQSTLIGLPSPGALRSDHFPGVRIGSEPSIGMHCVIYGNVFIGDRFSCGDNVFIRDSTAIGDGVRIGEWSFIDSDVVIADSVTIGNEVWIPRFTRIGSDVVIGSGVRFVMDQIFPQPRIQKNRGTILEDGCVLENNAVIGPGVCVGTGARVPEGSVVTGDVPADNYGDQ
ncbi:MAG: N-acetyltransferase [Methanoregula sp.]|jgi:acetyltransferase-like isoleucine patch superfamily enzyme|nr:N-acetyltransferase [Methanoregula sp.]